jgi:hypothetical protein
MVGVGIVAIVLDQLCRHPAPEAPPAAATT